MVRIRRAAFLLVAFAALMVLVAAGRAWWQRPVLPPDLIPPAGRYDVRILRDTWGVPHIYGKTDADVAYGLAYAHSEDDFSTIQGALLAARGRLASVYGPDAAPNDYMVELFEVNRVVSEGYPRLSPQVRAVCEAYAEGLNHYASLHPDEALAGLYPARGEDLVRGFVHKTPLFFGLDTALKELFEEERQRDVAGPQQARAERAPAEHDPQRFFDFAAQVKGSNTFAVAPSRSADGGTYLAINSHQPWEGPVAWYEAHLHSEEGWDMVGGVFPGAPIVLHGHNRHLGWAHTVNRPDLLDVYVLETDPEAPDRYRFDGEWHDLEKRDAAISVKLFGPRFAPFVWKFKREVLASVHGPAVRRPHGTYAVRTASYGVVGHVEQWFRMNKATNFDQWQGAMRQLALPMFNTGYADRDGNIYYVYNGTLPRRRKGYDYSQYLPGDLPEPLWQRYVPYDELPQVLNPESGFLQNCNSSPFETTLGPGNPDPARYSPTLGLETSMSNRGLRLLELLGADASISFEEFLDYKFDIAYSERSKVARLRDRVVALAGGADPLVQEAAEVLARWDLETRIDSRETALAVHAFFDFFRSGDVDDEPGDEELLAAVKKAAETLKQHHGRLDVPWGEVNRLRRGELDMAVNGGPDILHAVYGQPTEDGHLVGVAGDSYVLMVAWDRDGEVRSHSVHQFGSATLDEDSPHYADQAELFVERRLKPVWMDEAEIRANLKREYRPGE